MAEIGLGITLLSLMIWLVLLLGRGQFWRCDQQLEAGQLDPTPHSLLPTSPSICAVIPARDEADLLPVTLRSLLSQDYPGQVTVILVDDHSTDGTAQTAKETAELLDKSSQLHVILAEPLPVGWSGKLWAMDQGVKKAQAFSPDYILLTDADIEHDPANLSRLVTKAIQQNLDMASVMVQLRCESFWEQVLIPAFVFFFQKLYPFRWVNNPANSTAAAAGGCILIRTEALNRIGGIETIRQALIDDCALAQAVKQSEQGTENRAEENFPTSTPNTRHPTPHKIWLGLSDRTRSLRPYPSLKTIWDMVARTAFTQLNYSPLLLIGTLIGMVLVYLVPPVALVIGAVAGNWSIAILGLIVWLLMTLAYFPTIRFYRCSPMLVGCLPAIGFLYTLMTIDSALRYWRGQGGAWKGRVYPG